ncbi:hypothetical protein [Candidatus Chloroploca sp. Khr17]|uniref:hypothetical protein n=1 Tax=Candidatus Chloroploca sp. Khr17 TaxID=2496869 RepID=UPI00101C571C|nr:hypothetical protein [Candidatus Chloroploca sp. Khr17]
MTHGEQRLVEEGWDALVERLGLAEATRFVMLLDRRTGGALQHLRIIWSSTPHQARQSTTHPSMLQQVDR